MWKGRKSWEDHVNQSCTHELISLLILPHLAVPYFPVSYWFTLVLQQILNPNPWCLLCIRSSQKWRRKLHLKGQGLKWSFEKRYSSGWNEVWCMETLIFSEELMAWSVLETDRCLHIVFASNLSAWTPSLPLSLAISLFFGEKNGNSMSFTEFWQKYYIDVCMYAYMYKLLWKTCFCVFTSQ